MATEIEAVQKYGPRIAPGAPVDFKELIEYITRNSGQSYGETLQSVRNYVEAKRHYQRRGRAVHVDDDGAYYVRISLDGKITPHYRAEAEFADSIQSGFEGVVENAENIGKTRAQLVTLWNADPANANDQIPVP